MLLRCVKIKKKLLHNTISIQKLIKWINVTEKFNTIKSSKNKLIIKLKIVK